MRYAALAFILLTLAACSSAALVPSNNPRQVKVQTETGGQNVQYEYGLTSSNQTMLDTVAATPDAAWKALVEVYQSTQLPITSLDNVNRAVGIQHAPVRRRLLDAPLATFVDCGRGAARVPLANSHEVTISVASQLKPLVSNATQVQTLVTARAKDPIHNTPAAACTSTGRLELRIAEEMRKRLESGRGQGPGTAEGFRSLNQRPVE